MVIHPLVLDKKRLVKLLKNTVIKSFACHPLAGGSRLIVWPVSRSR